MGTVSHPSSDSPGSPLICFFFFFTLLEPHRYFSACNPEAYQTRAPNTRQGEKVIICSCATNGQVRRGISYEEFSVLRGLTDTRVCHHESVKSFK